MSYPFRGVHLDLDDEMYIYQMDTTGKSGQYQLYEVYKIHDEGAPQVNEVGKWTGETKALDFTDVDKNIRRRDLKVQIQMYICFYERASASALLVNGSLWQNPRDEGGLVFAFC